MSSRRPPPPSDARRTRSLLFGGALALALFGALFPWFPGGQTLQSGVVVQDSIVANRSHSYVSDVLTQERRTEAADAVEDVWVFDPSVRDRELADLERRIDRIEVARRDTTLSASARESAVRAASDGSLTERGAAALASADDERWEVLQEQARTVLGRTLAGPLDEGDLAAARLRAAGLFTSQISADESLALTELIDPLIEPTLRIDAARTAALRQEAMASQPPVRVNITRGEVVIPEGTVLTAADVERLDELGLRRAGVRLEDVASTALFAVLIGGIAGGYLAVAQPAALSSLRRLTLFTLLLLLPALVAKLTLPLLLPDEARHFLPYALPLAAAPIAATVLLDLAAALLLTLLLAAIAVFIGVYLPVEGGTVAAFEVAGLALVVVASSLGGLFVAARAARFQRYLVAGLVASVGAALALLSIWLLDDERRAVDLVWMAGAAAASGFFSATIAVGAFVLLSRPFGIVTRVELMELAQLNHPLLRRLQDEAPGTFQHSILVGNLAERAADRIGADPMLVRVGAYYHDIGKLVAPAFFVENTPPGDSPHEGLDPLQSTRVIHQHVTAGAEIARREGLPSAVTQFIPQHHGTRLTSYFYRRAAEVDPDIDPNLFRYPGPKPQTREAALVMLADACEATVRASAEHSAERIRGIVEGIIRERIEEGEFNECDISLRDLAIVGQSFASSMNAVYHPRVEYPEPSERERAARRGEAGGDRAAPPAGRAPDPVDRLTPPPRRPAARSAPGPASELSEDDS